MNDDWISASYHPHGMIWAVETSNTLNLNWWFEDYTSTNRGDGYRPYKRGFSFYQKQQQPSCPTNWEMLW